MKSVDNRLLRTYEDLQVGEYRIEYIRGSDNLIADTLSRAPINKPFDMDTGYEDSLLKIPEEPLMIIPGGPNSLFDAIHWAMDIKDMTADEVRSATIKYLLSNITKYGFESKCRDRKLIESWNNVNIFADHRLIQPFADLFSCTVTVKHVPGPEVKYNTKSTGKDQFGIVLHCRGGIHYDVLAKMEILQVIPMELRNREEKVLFIIKDVESECEGNVKFDLDMLATRDSNESASSKMCRSSESVVGECMYNDVSQVDSAESIRECMYNDVCSTQNADNDTLLLSWDEALVAVTAIHVDMGHPGRNQTLNVCRDRVRTKNLWKVVRECVKCCDVCQRFKEPNNCKQFKGPLYNLKSSETGEILALDLLDFTGKTKRGNKALLVAIDHYSKFGYGIPIRNKTAKTVARALESGILAGSVRMPKIILTDNGPEFRGRDFNALIENYGIDHKYSIPYRPQSNGCVERFNRTLKSRLATILDGEYGAWDQVIYKVLAQYNRSVHSESGRTPVSYYTEPKEDQVLSKNAQITREAGDKFKPYMIGELVLRRIPYFGTHERHKLAPKFNGPYEIVNKFSRVSYSIRDVRSGKIIPVIHCSQMRPYYGDKPVSKRKYRTREYRRRSVTLDPPTTPPSVYHRSPLDRVYEDAVVYERVRPQVMETNVNDVSRVQESEGVENVNEPDESEGGILEGNSRPGGSVSTPEKPNPPPIEFEHSNVFMDEDVVGEGENESVILGRLRLSDITEEVAIEMKSPSSARGSPATTSVPGKEKYVNNCIIGHNKDKKDGEKTIPVEERWVRTRRNESYSQHQIETGVDPESPARITEDASTPSGEEPVKELRRSARIRDQIAKRNRVILDIQAIASDCVRLARGKKINRLTSVAESTSEEVREPQEIITDMKNIIESCRDRLGNRAGTTQEDESEDLSELRDILNHDNEALLLSVESIDKIVGEGDYGIYSGDLREVQTMMEEYQEELNMLPCDYEEDYTCIYAKLCYDTVLDTSSASEDYAGPYMNRTEHWEVDPSEAVEMQDMDPDSIVEEIFLPTEEIKESARRLKKCHIC